MLWYTSYLLVSHNKINVQTHQRPVIWEGQKIAHKLDILSNNKMCLDSRVGPGNNQWPLARPRGIRFPDIPTKKTKD